MQKTKPTQHSVRQLRGLGLTPNILACRSAKVCPLFFLFFFKLAIGADVTTFDISIFLFSITGT